MPTSQAFYNEIDPFKAEVLREAIRAGAIAPGVVDERSIADISPSELTNYSQCHFFAGGGFWSLALRQAGWRDEWPVWTGSCPCPSFSAAGKGAGFRDPRHLWPAWFRLIRICKPSVVFGEQVANAINHGWLDLVSTDLEGEGYAVGAVVFGAHSVGAPHIRQRLYFCAQPEPRRLEQFTDTGRESASVFDETAQQGERLQPVGGYVPSIGGDNYTVPDRRATRRDNDGFGDVREWRGPGWLDPQQARSVAEAGATRGFWADCDWWYGRDGKWRPAGPGIQPLAHGSPARVGRLRLYGDAICVPAAQAFIEAYLETIRYMELMS